MGGFDGDGRGKLTEAILRGLGDATYWGLVTTDAQLTITGWNQWLELHSKIRSEEVVGRNLLEVFPELGSRHLEQFYRQALEGRMVVLAQRLHKYLLPLPPSVADAGLSHMPQSVRISPLIEGNAVVGTLTLIEDVTERTVYEAVLRTRARQQAVLASLSQSALVAEGLATLFDETALVVCEVLEIEKCRVLELAADGTTLLFRAGCGWGEGQLGTAGPTGKVGASEEHVLGSRGPLAVEDWAAESRFPVPDLMKEHGIVSSVEVSFGGGTRPFGLLGVYASSRRVLTEDEIHFLQAAANVLGLAVQRRQLEEQLRTHANKLAEGDRRKDEFLAMLAHELRNPLAPIRNALKLIHLSNEEHRPEVREAHGIIERQIENLVRLVDDLLDVSRITSGKIQLQKERVDLAAIVARAVEGARPLIEARRHTLELRLPKAAMPVDADPVRLAQVLWNLLNNAAKYTPDGGRITLTVERGGEDAVVRIRDTGTGITPEMLPKVFDLFTQMERTLDRAEGGLGIGLSLVRRLTELHGGTVAAASEGQGRGCEFTVRLPMLPHEAVAAEPARPVAAERHVDSVSGQRILVVDDNRDSAESLAMLLRLFGNDVRTVQDGRLALEVAAAYRPDVVLLDIGLPGLDGLEVCRRLRARTGGDEPLIVAMTGYGQEEDRRRSAEAGFNAHMVKPVDLETLQELLARPELAHHERIGKRKASAP